MDRVKRGDQFKTGFVMLAAIAVSALPALAQTAPGDIVPAQLNFEMSVVATGLENPWELSMGPDGFLWVTERTAGRITRINPADGSKSTLVEIGEVSAPGGQDGLLGMALHPELLTGTGNDYIYAAYTYQDNSRPPESRESNPSSPYRNLYAKIVRLTYDSRAGKLVDPVDLILGLPAGRDHNSGRLKMGPDAKLYYSIGDQGNNQLGNYCRPIEAQRLPTAGEVRGADYIAYQGKSLRLNLDGTIPADNPAFNGVRSHVFTYGHRNMQGLDFAPDGTLYAVGHGPKSDDEVNVLQAGKNYGWPHVAGYRDNMAYEYARWAEATTPCASLTFSDVEIDPSVPRARESDWRENFEAPLTTLFTVPDDWNFSDPACDGVDYICWPTVAPSSIATYMPGKGGIPGWERTLLITSLKRGSLYVLPLTEDGQTLNGPVQRVLRTENRYRDLAVSPDKRILYVATDIGGVAESLNGGVTFEVQNPGAILAFTYTD